MPELPEVEVVRRGLDRWVAGRTVASARVLHPRAARRHPAGPVDLQRRLAGRTVLTASRRGKYLWLRLDGDEALVAHLGMSGQLLVQPPDATPETHLRAVLEFADGGRELRFVDQRTFGGLALDPLAADGAGGRVPASVAHIARDPLDPLFDDDAFVRGLRRRRTGVKRALLDQTLLSGVGNIYADEALWRSRLHWARATEGLPPKVVRGLLGDVRDVMAEALAEGGTSFDALYVNVNGESGYFARGLNAYGRRDLPCPRCGAPMVRDAFMNRSSYRCPRCQRTPARPRW
ncbi:MAG: bifunctional DNA-formamidopyrimidine glycosylase/DNA-(apurinic or apyrimidinic site) lyase [Candidatus Nanopelagicales bacterium]